MSSASLPATMRSMFGLRRTASLTASISRLSSSGRPSSQTPAVTFMPCRAAIDGRSGNSLELYVRIRRVSLESISRSEEIASFDG